MTGWYLSQHGITWDRVANAFRVRLRQYKTPQGADLATPPMAEDFTGAVRYALLEPAPAPEPKGKGKGKGQPESKSNPMTPGPTGKSGAR